MELCSNVDCRLVEEKVGEEEIPTEFLVRSPRVTAMVRKELAVCIRDLIHHGLGQTRPGAGILPFSGCMSGMYFNGKYFSIEYFNIKYFNTKYFYEIYFGLRFELVFQYEIVHYENVCKIFPYM